MKKVWLASIVFIFTFTGLAFSSQSAFAGIGDLTLVKTANPVNVLAGANTVVTYTFQTDNNSNEDLIQCSLVDPLFGTIFSGQTILIGESRTDTETLIINSDTPNTATLTCITDSGTTFTRTSIASVNAVSVSLAMTKTPNPPSVMTGESSTYTYVIFNNGDEPVTCQDINDDVVGTVATNSVVIQPGQSAQFTASSGPLQKTTTNLATVVCTDTNNNSGTAMASVTVTVESVSIAMTKTADQTLVEAGTLVTFMLDITNNGTVEVTCNDINDDKLGTIATNSVVIQPGQSAAFSATAIIDFTITNSATVVCVDDKGFMVTATAMETVTVIMVGGEFLPIDTTALMLAGIQSSAIWMLPVLAGAAGAGYYLVKFRNKED